MIGATAGFPVSITRQRETGVLSTPLTAAEYETRTDSLRVIAPAAPSETYRDLPEPGFSLAIASFPGLKRLRSKLLPAAGGHPVVNL